METIHIALPSDQNYVIGLTATAGSIALHASKDVRLLFHVLDGGISDDTFSHMASKVKRLHPNVDFNKIKVDDDLFKDYPIWSGNKMTYARLLLSDALPNVEHILYSDTDFLWLIDIAELWKLRSSDKILLGVLDHHSTIAKEEKWARENGMAFDRNSYFGAGLSFYNLEMFRKEKIVTQVSEFLIKHPDVPFADQTALNHILRGRISFIPKKWQTLSIELTPECVRNPLAIHYGGDIPWRRDKFWTFPISDSTLLWFAMIDYANQVPFGTTIKTYLTPWQRLYKRTLAYVYKYPPTKLLFNSLLTLTGRGSYIANFKKFAIDLKMTDKEIYSHVTSVKMTI